MQAKRIDVRTRGPEGPLPGAIDALPFYKTEDEWLLDTEGVNLMEVGAALGGVGVGVRVGARVGLGLRLRVLVAARHGGRQPDGGRWVLPWMRLGLG